MMFDVPEKPTGRKRRWVLSVVVFLVVGGLAVGASIVVFYFGEGGVERLGDYFRQLPLTGEGQPLVDESGEGQDGLPESGQVGEEEEEQTTTPASITQYNLAVTIQYRRQPNFTLEISELERTTEKANIQSYKVAEESPYSVLQILDAQDRVIVEEKFQVVTEVIVDGLGENTSPIYALESSVSRFVLSLPDGEIPAKIRLVTPEERVLDEQEFLFNDLSSAVEAGLWKQIAGLLSWGKQALGASSSFNIVVISSVPQTPGFPPGVPDRSVLNRVANGIRGDMLAIDPWSIYTSQINVRVVENVQDLGCRIIDTSGGLFPLCPNQGMIQQELFKQGIDWDAVVVVVMDVSCNCGTSGLGSLMTGVGSLASGSLVAHEFGHAIAIMADEYFGDRDLRGPAGPNCFGSLEECQGVIDSYNDPAGSCRQGCNNPDTYRPANLLMYNNLSSGQFGPVEKCIMGRSIAAVLDTKYEGNCGEEDPEDDATNEPGDGMGWYREY